MLGVAEVWAVLRFGRGFSGRAWAPDGLMPALLRWKMVALGERGG
jgi:hypothetical protein